MTQCAPVANMIETDYHETVATIEGVHNVEMMVSRHMHEGQDWDENGLIVGRNSVPLRSVFSLLEGKHKFECIIDRGLQIVAMSDIVWAKLRNNLQTDKSITMETVNASVLATQGRLHNVKFTFGDLDLYLQVQVVPSAPYEVLLGRPFLMLKTCTTCDWPDGDQQITIINPNSGQTAMIPTYERIKYCPKSDFH